MKKITLLLTVLFLTTFSWQSNAQVLNQNASWPNAAWTVTGTYNTGATAFEADPTTTANFSFDDDDAGNGSDDDIAAESPVIDLTAASTAGETWITISGDYVFNFNNDDILQFEYWDADASTWNIIGTPFSADTASAPTDLFCAGTAAPYTTAVLDIAAFTATQLSGFRYRIYYDDTVGGPGWEWGFCFQSPTIVSAAPPACIAPTTLTATNITINSADLGWTSAETLFDVEVVIAGTAATGTPTDTGVANPFTKTMLNPTTSYEYYVRSDCGGGSTSVWSGPFAFTTPVAPIVPDYLNDFTTFPGLAWSEAAGVYGTPTGTSSGWTNDDYGNDVAHANGQSAKINIWGTSVDEYLISPEFDLSAGTYYLNMDLAFTAWNTTNPAVWGADDYVALLVTQDGTTWTELTRWDSTSTIGVARTPASEITLTGYNTTTKFAFYAFSDTTNEDNDFFVDNFQITAAPLSVESTVIEGFTMYPNPVNDILRFNALDTIETISIYNLLGQEVLNAKPNAVQTEVSMSNLTTGVYVVKVKVGNQLGTYKVIKK